MDAPQTCSTPAEEAAQPNWTELSRVALRAAYALGARPQWAPDIAQDAMLRLVCAGGVRYPRAWLRTVIRRLAIREKAPMRAEPLEETPDGVIDARGRDPELSLDVRWVLSRLRGSDRRALLLWLAGFKQREIGDRLGWSVKSVGSRIHRAQARARSLRDAGLSRTPASADPADRPAASQGDRESASDSDPESG